MSSRWPARARWAPPGTPLGGSVTVQYHGGVSTALKRAKSAATEALAEGVTGDILAAAARPRSTALRASAPTWAVTSPGSARKAPMTVCSER